MKFDFTVKNLTYWQRTYILTTVLWSFLINIHKKFDWNQFGHNVILTLKMIWKHGIVIILMLIPVLLLIILPQGKDLINNMLFDISATWLSTYLRVLWFVTMIIFTSYSIWVIPRFYQKYEEKKFSSEKNSDKSTSGNFLRVLSVVPFVVYGIVFFILDPRCFTPIYLYWAVLVLAGLAIISLCIHLLYSKLSLGTLMYILLGACLFLPIGYTYLNFQSNKEHSIMFLGNGLLFLAGMAYVILLRWERPFKSKISSPDKLKQIEKTGDTIYLSVLLSSIAIMLLFSLITNMMYVTTVSLLTMIMGCQILWLNLIVYKYKTLKGFKQFLSFIGLMFLIWWVHFPESKPHRVFLVDKSKIQERPTLDSFMSKWLEFHYGNIDTTEANHKPIYLVAGEGGGSRAGLWYATFIQELDSLTLSEFSKQTLATSTISGSSVGSSLLSKWYRVAEDLKLSRINNNITPNLAKKFFTNNFTAGAVFDLFYLDFVRRFSPFPSRSGRNLRLQQEENVAFLQIGANDSAKISDIWNPIPGKYGSSVQFNGQSVSNYHFLPIQDLWLKENGDLILDIPLNFFNTTEMSTGRQFAIAPVSFSFNAYVENSLDLISQIEKYNCSFKNNHAIALGTANNLSQMFPFFSAYTHIDNVGHFMDGGGCDNSGTKTLKFIYLELKKHIKNMESKSGKKPPIVVIYVSNGNADPQEKDLEQKKVKSQIIALMGQAGAQPFEMITKESIHVLEKTVKDNDDYYYEASWSSFNKKIPCPKGCVDSLLLTFPTARSLTSQNIDSIIYFAKLKAREIYTKIEKDKLTKK